MLSKKEFFLWTEKLLSKHKLNPNLKNQFVFLIFENYNIFSNANNFIIYEDWWIKNPKIVKSKIKSILKISNRIFARQCVVKKINKPESEKFLNKNHLYGSAKSKIKYGLFYKEKLYAVATFAGQRQFHNGSRSVELLRFCNKNGTTVIGGLDKLLQAYIKEYQPDTIMTYIDLDWGRGDAFLNIGFETKEIKPPILFYVNKQTGERIQEKYFNDFENLTKYTKVKNSGSVKMIKTIL